MEIVKTLLLIYACVLLLNAVYSAFLYFYHRDRLYLYSLFLWLSTFANATLQGIFQGSSTQMILSFSTYFISAMMLAKILSFVTRRKLPFRSYVLAMCAGLIASLAAIRMGAEFVVIALPAAVGVSLPMFHSAISTLVRKMWNPSNRMLVQIYSALLVINGLHFMDYPFLRMNPDFSAAGFSVALIILLAFSIFLPSFLIKDISDRYMEKVTELNAKLMDYQRQMAELMSLAQVGEMSFSFVHDMASPTTLLLHYSKEIAALNEKGIDDGRKVISYSKGIEQATVRLVGLQKLFRALLRKESSAGPAEIDLCEIVNKVADLFRPYLEFHRIDLELRLLEKAKTIVNSQGAVERILLNLIQNAVEALSRVEVKKIEISLEESAETFALAIRDTGPGISEERKAHLWKRFGHSDTAKKKSAGEAPSGSGFGLYKIKELVDQIEGQIQVESSNLGTCFKIDISKKSGDDKSSKSVA